MAVEPDQATPIHAGDRAMKLHKLIDIETTSSIEDPDAPIAQGTHVSRPNHNRSTVYSVRLSPDEVASDQELVEYAEYAEYAEAIPGPSRQATPNRRRSGSAGSQTWTTATAIEVGSPWRK